MATDWSPAPRTLPLSPLPTHSYYWDTPLALSQGAWLGREGSGWPWVQAQSDSLVGRQGHDSVLSTSDRPMCLGLLALLPHLIWGVINLIEV